MPITLRSLGQIAVDLTEAMNWLEEIQVPYKESRVEKLSDFIFHRLMNSSTSESTDLESGAVSPRIYYALVDAAALGLIAREFAGCHRAAFRGERYAMLSRDLSILPTRTHRTTKLATSWWNSN